MPCFVFKVRRPAPPERAGSFRTYQAARAAVRAMRADLRGHDFVSVRMVFAPSEAQAERLLTERREPRPLGEDA